MAKKAKPETNEEIIEEAVETAHAIDAVEVTEIETPVAGTDSDDATESAAEVTTGAKLTAKAGKRSAKAVAEAEAEAERKSAAPKEQETPKPRIVQKPNPLKQHGKNYRDALKLVDRMQHYTVAEAIDLAQKTSKVKFDASVELHINLGVDPRQADQMVRSTVTLPAGTGKKVRVAVLAGADKHEAAKKAGADIVSDDSLLADIEKGKLNFDILIATPDMMPKLGKLAKVLGPRGLMPNPKSGTVTANVAGATQQAKAGRVEFRIDKQALLHIAIGKVSFKPADLENNFKAALDAVLKSKPSATKGTYIQAVSLTTTMGPGIKLDVQQAIATANPKR